MLKLTHSLIPIAILCLGVISMAQLPAAPNQPGVALQEPAGIFNRHTKETLVTEGLPTSNLFDLDTALAALGEKQGYTTEGLKKLKTLLTNSLQTGDILTDGKPSSCDALVEIVEQVPIIKFKMSAEDLSRFQSFDQAFGPPPTTQECHYVGACRVCDGKIRGCIIKGLRKPSICNAKQ